MKQLLIAVFLLAAVPVFAQPKPAAPMRIEAQQKAQVERANDEFFQALAQRDMKILERRIASDAVFADSDGVEFRTKNSFLQPTSLKNSQVKSVVAEDWTIRFQRGNAVVVGRGTLKMLTKKSQTVYEFGFVHVWTKRAGRWQLLISHSVFDASQTPSSQ